MAVVTLVGVAQAAAKKGEVPSYYGPQPVVEAIDLTMYVRIREEGLKHSHVMQFGALHPASWLGDKLRARWWSDPHLAVKRCQIWGTRLVTRQERVQRRLQ